MSLLGLDGFLRGIGVKRNGSRRSVRMGLVDLFQFAFEALTARRLRSALTVMMVLIGASLVTSLNGMTQGMNTFVNSQLSSLAPNVLIVLPAPRSIGSFGPPPAPVMTFNEQTVNTLRGFHEVREVIPFYRGAAKISAGGFSKNVNVLGIDHSKLQFVTPSISVDDGHLVSKTDSLGIVLGSKVAYPPGQIQQVAKVAQIVSLEFSYVETKGGQQRSVVERRSFQVKGILNPIGDDSRDESVYISPPAANAFMKKSGKYDGMYAITTNIEANGRLEKAVLGYFGPTSIGVISPKSIAERVQSIIGGFRTFMTTVALVSLIVGAIGIVTTLFTSVMERTTEIGVLKAIGFDNKLVLLIFLCESAAIGVLGGTLGIGIGSASANMVVRRLPLIQFQGRNVQASLAPEDLAFTWGLSVFLSILAGLYPAWRASKLDPVDALRKE